MNESDETLEKENSAVLKAIADLSRKIDGLENRFDNLENRFDKLESRFDNLEKDIAEKFRNADAQFEAIREGIVYNSSKFDRLEAVVYNTRGDISNLRADIKDLTEEVRQNRKSLV